MIATKPDIMALVDRIGQTKRALETAQQAASVAQVALREARTVVEQADDDFRMAQIALVVAAGGTDISWMLGVPRPAACELNQKP